MVFIKNAMFVVLNNVYIRISSNIKILMCIFKSFLVTLFVLWHCKWLKNMRPTFLFYLINFFISPLPWAVCSTLYTTLIWSSGKAMGKLSKRRWNFFPYEYISNNGNLKYESSISYKHIEDCIFTFTDHEW